MSGAVIPSGFVKTALHNGVGRYVCQLQRITLKFCKSHGGSRGVREFIENDLLEFTRQNPGIVVYLQPQRHRSPAVTAEFLNQKTTNLSLQNKSREEVCQWLDLLRSQSGEEVVRLRKMWHTYTPSIQGIWTPFTNKDTMDNVRDYPNEELSRYIPLEETATEKLMKLAKELREKEGDKMVQGQTA